MIWTIIEVQLLFLFFSLPLLQIKGYLLPTYIHNLILVLMSTAEVQLIQPHDRAVKTLIPKKKKKHSK